MKRSEALAFIEAVKAMRENAGDAIASLAAGIYPKLKNNGSLVKVGTRINWRGAVKRAAVDLWDTAENDPDHAPTLWEDIEYREGYRIIPEVITAGTAFSKGERGWWGDDLYESLIDANVYTPEQYAYGWDKVVEYSAERGNRL